MVTFFKCNWILIIAANISIIMNSVVETFGQNLSTQIAFISDTQAPMWIEDLFLRNHNNIEATKILFDDVIKKAPRNIFILGDVVNLGYKTNRWKSVDKFLLSTKSHKIPVYAVLGNHELMGNHRRGEYNFQSRFPEHVPSGYVIRIDSVAIVLLNSNFHKMDSLQIKKQDNWYSSALASLENDPDVKKILVCCHHSPYSNSRLVGSNYLVQEKFVKPFFQAQKTKLFLSGHAHLFQHFKKEGKDFLVIGGGGGLKHPVKSLLMEDESKGYAPLFHYLLIELHGSLLKNTSRKIKTDFTGFEDGYSFIIN